MPICSNCSQVKSKLNRGDLCKICFDNKLANNNSIASESVEVSLSNINVMDLIKENMTQEKQHNAEIISMLKEQIDHFKLENIHKNTTIERLMTELYNYTNSNTSRNNITPENKKSDELINLLSVDIEFLKKELDSKNKIIELLLKDGIANNNENDNDSCNDVFIYPKRTNRANCDTANVNNIELNNRFGMLNTEQSNWDESSNYGIANEICDDDICITDPNAIIRDDRIIDDFNKSDSLIHPTNIDKNNMADRNVSTSTINERFLWQKHSSGVASKIMRKMGYKGKGLGKLEDGITEPVTIKPRKNMQHDTYAETNIQEDHYNKKNKLLYIASSSMLNQMDEKRLSTHNINVKVRCHGGCTVKCMYTHLPELFNLRPDYILLHIGSNDCVSKTSDEVLHEIKQLTVYITKELPLSKIIISLPIVRSDNSRANQIQKHLKLKLQRLMFPCLDNSNVDLSHLGKKGLHLNYHGIRIMARNIISLIKRL